MKYEDVLALAKAGFSSQQIAQFAEEERAAAITAAESLSEAPASEMPQAPSEMPKAPEAAAAPPPIAPPAPKANPIDQILMEINQELASLKKSIQSKNLQNTNQPIRESTESILASIISPTYTHKED